MKVVVVGAGWAGCAAAVAARKQGAEVTLIERTDMLIGTGLVGGIMGNNGRFTASRRDARHVRGRPVQAYRRESAP